MYRTVRGIIKKSHFITKASFLLKLTAIFLYKYKFISLINTFRIFRVISLSATANKTVLKHIQL